MKLIAFGLSNEGKLHFFVDGGVFTRSLDQNGKKRSLLIIDILWGMRGKLSIRARQTKSKHYYRCGVTSRCNFSVTVNQMGITFTPYYECHLAVLTVE